MSFTAPQISLTSPGQSDIQVVAMSRAEFESLPQQPKAEWVDGKAYIMMAPVAYEHGRASMRLGALFITSLNGVDVVGDVGLRMRSSDRGPDIMIYPHDAATRTWVTEVPVLVTEIVSPSTRSQDYFAKATEYARAGVEQYWIVDPQLQIITILSNDGEGAWNLIVELNAEKPNSVVEVGEWGSVVVDLREIF